MYLTNKNITYICNKYGDSMSENLINQLIRFPNFINNVTIQEINCLRFILLKSKKYKLSCSSVEYVLALITSLEVHTMDTINILLEISTNIKSDQESILLDLIAMCSQNVSNFDFKKIIPLTKAKYSGKKVDTTYKVIETIITFSRAQVDKHIIKHLNKCYIYVQNPERFF